MIQPKYEIGQQVWVVEVQNNTQNRPCPDCLGLKYWPITVPGGDTFDLECATCRYGYEVRGFITIHTVAPTINQMTIGSIRTNTHSDHPVEYMMEETGVGSGRVWYETDVFAAAADAQPRLAEKQAELQSQLDAQDAARIVHNRKNHHKPTYEQRRIRELEKEIKELTIKLKEK